MVKSYENIIGLLNKSKNKFFFLKFIKRTTGETRLMSCRRGVTKHLKGGELNYVPKSCNLITVFDIQKKAYRAIPVEGIIEMKIGGKTFSFKNK